MKILSYYICSQNYRIIKSENIYFNIFNKSKKINLMFKIFNDMDGVNKKYKLKYRIIN